MWPLGAALAATSRADPNDAAERARSQRALSQSSVGGGMTLRMLARHLARERVSAAQPLPATRSEDNMIKGEMNMCVDTYLGISSTKPVGDTICSPAIR